MKKSIIITTVLLLVLPLSFAQPKIIFHYPEEDKSYFYDIIDSINETYYDGLKQIDIYNPEKTMFYYQGLYLPYQYKLRTNTNKGNFEYVLIHELAHHHLFMANKGIKSCNINHQDCFYDMQEEITNEII